MAASTIPAAKAALLSALQARVALVDVVVAWGLPAKPPQQSEAIYVDDAIDVERDWVSLGARRLDERYTLQVRVETIAYGDDSDLRQTVEERMWVLVAEIEQTVRDDLTLGGTLYGTTAKPAGVEPLTFPTDTGWIAHALVRIDCMART